MARIPSSLVAAAGLIGGYGVARATKKRELGGVALVAAGAVAAFAGSHPLAKKVGAWPSVLTVAGGVALASWAAVDRRS
jgi:hypothetical protein